ncbi:hypothetical protein PR048_010065 [Dryococelus australis]|uniref:Uncharacterized protein n=1 Tax=Dryococelus australis TaxID=614101 RepID=A0ABQ9I2F9_9NEOP|nr:hypothetical protein PR048_010065 [Dryococelus australis]
MWAEESTKQTVCSDTTYLKSASTSQNSLLTEQDVDDPTSHDENNGTSTSTLSSLPGSIKNYSSPVQSTTNYSKTKSQISLNDAWERGTPYSKTHPRAQQLTKHICKMVAVDGQPFSFVENEGFKWFMATADPRYSIATRQELSHKLIPDLYKNTPFLLHKITTLQTLEFWGIQDKVVAIVRDNATDVTSAVQKLKMSAISFKSVHNTSCDWNTIGNIEFILKLFSEVMKTVSKSSCSISEVIPILNSLRLAIESDNTMGLQNMKNDIFHYLDAYYPIEATETNRFYALATCLDPR